MIKKYKRVKTKTGVITRSAFEGTLISQLESLKAKYGYETKKIKYHKPAVNTTYTPDFVVITASGKEILIEGKGEFTSADRSKHILIKKQHPELDIRFVFMYPRARLYKGSSTTYADWCDKYGFLYSGKLINVNWLLE